MILLPSGCRASRLKVTPSNWQSKNAPINMEWRIDYRFYDPGRSKPKQVRIQGMNRLKDLKERQAATRELIRHEMDLLTNHGLNPFTQSIEGSHSGLNPKTHFIQALKEVFKTIGGVRGTRNDISSVISGIEEAAIALRLDDLEINEVRRKHIKEIFAWCKKNNSRFSDNRYNMYRAYLMKLFKELLELEAVDHNPVTDISKKAVTKNIRATLTPVQRAKVDKHLKMRSYFFWRFVQVFFHSGARETELMQVKYEHVDLENQRYKCLIRKGRQYRWVNRTIKIIALPYWEEIMSQAKPGQFLFSKNLVPGNSTIRADQVGRRWNRYVKQELGIKVDLYSLKHLNTTETVDLLGDQDAAAMNAHTSTAMVIGIYDTGREKRQHDRLRKLNNPFS